MQTDNSWRKSLESERENANLRILNNARPRPGPMKPLRPWFWTGRAAGLSVLSPDETVFNTIRRTSSVRQGPQVANPNSWNSMKCGVTFAMAGLSALLRPPHGLASTRPGQLTVRGNHHLGRGNLILFERFRLVIQSVSGRSHPFQRTK